MSRLAAPDAAAALGVDTETLATWRARFGFPTSYSEQHRDYYSASDIEALREAVRSELSVPRAIEAARRRAEVDPD
jgi:DNA-binding transcriptional MerR regulator